MESKEKFELSEEELDEVAGGASTLDFSKCPYPDRSIVRNRNECCMQCYGPGKFDTRHYEAKLIYGYNAGADTGKILCQCTRCNGGYYGNLSVSWLLPESPKFRIDWGLA